MGDVEGLGGRTYGERAPHINLLAFLMFPHEGGHKSPRGANWFKWVLSLGGV
jgi:hypothetical protein